MKTYALCGWLLLVGISGMGCNAESSGAEGAPSSDSNATSETDPEGNQKDGIPEDIIAQADTSSSSSCVSFNRSEYAKKSNISDKIQVCVGGIYWIQDSDSGFSNGFSEIKITNVKDKTTISGTRRQFFPIREKGSQTCYFQDGVRITTPQDWNVNKIFNAGELKDMYGCTGFHPSVGGTTVRGLFFDQTKCEGKRQVCCF